MIKFITSLLRFKFLCCCYCFILSLRIVDGTPSCISRRNGSSVCFATWPIQAASAAVSYIGLVAALDRPKGALNEENVKSLRVGPSKVAGLGLFCDEPRMPKGTILGTYPGTLMPLEQNLQKLKQHPCCEFYIWRFSDSKMLIDPTNERGEIEDYTYGGSLSTVGSVWICRNLLGFLRRPTTLCRINEPPKGYDVNVQIDEDLENRVIKFFLARDVYKGEEFFLDYGVGYDRSSYGKFRPPS